MAAMIKVPLKDIISSDVGTARFEMAYGGVP